ncbi:MAG: ABC transporter ATP-binding protein [Planctomycetota bacterium]
MIPLLSIQNLSVAFSKRGSRICVLSNFSLDIHSGQCVGIVGESGSGKSTAFLAALRLLGPNANISASGLFYNKTDSLTITDLLTIEGESLRQLRGKQIAMIFQDATAALNPYLTIGRQLSEVLEIHAIARGAAARRIALESLHSVALPDPEICYDRYPHQLSGGQRQRAAIAMAFITNPSLVIADEPTTALDPTVQLQILALLRKLQKSRGMSILLISHDLGVVAGLCDRVAVVYAGRVVEEASTEELFSAPKHPYTAALLGTLLVSNSHAPIGGSPPPAGAAALPGCAFAPRCARARPNCSIETPTETRESGRRYCCFYPIEGNIK